MSSMLVISFLNDVSSRFNLGKPQPQAAAASVPRSFDSQQPSRFSRSYQDRSHPVVINNVNNSGSVPASSSGKAEEKSRETKAAVAGAIIAILGSAVSAFMFSTYRNERDEIVKYRKFSAELEYDPYHPTGLGLNPLMNSEKRGQLKFVADTAIQDCKRKCSRVRNYSILTVAAVAIASAAFIGGMLSMQWLITASIVSGVGLAMVSAGLVSGDYNRKNALPENFETKISELLQYFKASPADAPPAYGDIPPPSYNPHNR